MVLLAVSTVMLAGCAAKLNGMPTAPPSPSAGAGAAQAAPRVADPLDATRFLAQPCELLTPTQLATFGVTRPGMPDVDSRLAKQVGPSCLWHADPRTNSSIGVGFTLGNPNGLSDIYRVRKRYAYFVEDVVDGYPAVFHDIDDGRESGVCNISVGISDTLMFGASEQGGRKGQASCDRVKQVASAVIATLRVGV